MMVVIGGALLIGLTLGLLGSGGSILTVPVLVYVLGHDGKAAIAESLAVVGGISLVATLQYARARQVDWRSVLLFGVPGMAGTWGGAWLSRFVPETLQLVLFACVMLLAAGMMFRRARNRAERTAPVDSPVARRNHPEWQIATEGALVGILTGLVGVGGGFLIVPALVVLGGLPMRLAVGTSLMVIALKSGSGFLKYLGVLSTLGGGVDWPTIGIFLAVGIPGTLLGKALNTRLNQQLLQRAFAGFLVLMGIFVLSREIPRLIPPVRSPSAQLAAPATQPSASAVPVPHPRGRSARAEPVGGASVTRKSGEST